MSLVYAITETPVIRHNSSYLVKKRGILANRTINADTSSTILKTYTNPLMLTYAVQATQVTADTGAGALLAGTAHVLEYNQLAANSVPDRDYEPNSDSLNVMKVGTAHLGGLDSTKPVIVVFENRAYLDSARVDGSTDTVFATFNSATI